jgi:hypothetical protein
MNFPKSCVLSFLLIAGCNSDENSTSKIRTQSQAKDKQTAQAHAEPNNISALHLKKKLLGSWTDGNTENAVFEVKQDSIYYMEQFKSYKYSLNRDSISIVYDDFTFEGQIQFINDTLIMIADEWEPQKFWRFTN